jgi:hypothetical protein
MAATNAADDSTAPGHAAKRDDEEEECDDATEDDDRGFLIMRIPHGNGNPACQQVSRRH